MSFSKRRRQESNLSKVERILLNQGLCVCTARELREHMEAALQAARSGRNRNETGASQADARTTG